MQAPVRFRAILLMAFILLSLIAPLAHAQDETPLLTEDFYLVREGYWLSMPTIGQPLVAPITGETQTFQVTSTVDDRTFEIHIAAVQHNTGQNSEETLQLDIYTGAVVSKSDTLYEILSVEPGPAINIMGRSIESRMEKGAASYEIEGWEYACEYTSYLHPDVELALKREETCLITYETGEFQVQSIYEGWVVDTNLDLGDTPATGCLIRSPRPLNLRGGAGTDFTISGNLSYAQIAEVDGQTNAPDGFVWWKLADSSDSTDSSEKWVRSDLVEPLSDCTLAPEVE